MDSELYIRKVPLPKPVIDIAAGSDHSVAVCEGEVFVWGKAHHCNLGNPHCEEERINSLEVSAESAAAGDNHTFIWRKNDVFCWGSNSYFELGLGIQGDYAFSKSTIFEEAFQAGLRLKKITCGESHSLAVFEEEAGQCCLFAWGNSRNHQLGLETNLIVPEPVQVEFEGKIMELQSRSDFNMLIDEKGQCHSWGSNIFGRIGFPNSIKNRKVPTPIPGLIRIRTIALGKYHCLALDQEGHGFSWGHGMHGQLAIGKTVSEIGPTSVQCSSRILQVACGESHTLVLTEEALFSCGSNSYQALGHHQADHRKRCLDLAKVNLPVPACSIAKIVCGNRHNLILTTDKSVFAWGCNKFNQLGLGSAMGSEAENSPIGPDKLQNSERQAKFLDWKQRYEEFKKELRQREKKFMEELDRIME